MPTAAPRPLHGILFVIAAVALFACFDAGVKVASAIASVGLVVWARYMFQVGFTALTVLPRRGTALLKTQRPGLQLLRGLSLLSLSVLAFFSLQVMPVGEFTAIVMLTPLLITLLATLTLGERIPALRWLLLAGGMVGALVVIRPKGEAHDLGWAALLPFGLVLSNAVFQLITSRLARTEDPATTQFYTGLTGAVLTSVLLPWSWQTLTPAGWALLVLLGALSTSGHFLLILGYMRAGAATLTPFLYFQIIFATLVGWLWFGHAPDAATLGGIAIITGCGVLGTWLSSRERTGPVAVALPQPPQAGKQPNCSA
ncbi:DMT family transporter [Sphaerotilus montanus]|nr:DMT family transporter [Sphaerotilus montanus]